jgi:hypothetical protein
MANCGICGGNTSMYVFDEPVCLQCDNTEGWKKRNELSDVAARAEKSLAATDTR